MRVFPCPVRDESEKGLISRCSWFPGPTHGPSRNDDVPLNNGAFQPGSASTYMLGAEAEADEAGGEPPQQRHPSQETDREWRRHLCVARQHAADHAVLQDHLKPLRRARRKLAPALHGFEIPLRNRTLEKPRGQNVRGGDRVL